MITNSSLFCVFKRMVLSEFSMMKRDKYRCVYPWACFACLLVNFDMYRMYEWTYMTGHFCFFRNPALMLVDLRLPSALIFRLSNSTANE